LLFATSAGDLLDSVKVTIYLNFVYRKKQPTDHVWRKSV